MGRSPLAVKTYEGQQLPVTELAVLNVDTNIDVSETAGHQTGTISSTVGNQSKLVSTTRSSAASAPIVIVHEFKKGHGYEVHYKPGGENSRLILSTSRQWEYGWHNTSGGGKLT